MKTYYSVIFASINAVISERLSVGLILTNGEQNWFAYSSKKLSFIKHFYTDESYQLLKSSLRNIDHAMEKINNKNPIAENVLYDAPSTYKNSFSVGYLEYLNRYSNATLTFANPVEIDVPASDELFQHLYTEMVFIEEDENKTFFSTEKVKAKLYPLIKNNVNLDRNVETSEIEGLIIPIKLDFIGKNENPVIGKFADFNQHNYHLDSAISGLFVLMKTFEINNKTGKYFVIGSEPEKRLIKQHKTWKEIQNSKILECVPFEETERIVTYMSEHSVLPFFE